MTPLPAGVAADLAAAARDDLPRMIRMRRDLHAHPEMAFDEHRTARLVADELSGLGFEVRAGVGDTTGVVGILRGGRPGRTVALRADMDALPFEDEKAVAYRSTVSGVMHACGHDAHVAMQLGVARIAAARRDLWPGTLVLVFEPAEEMIGLEWTSGAQRLVEAGVLDDPAVDGIFGCHVMPDYPTGTVATRAGSMLAGSDVFELDILGRESHTAQVDAGRDAILCAAQVIVALQSLVSREHPLTGVGNLTIGTISGGKALNLLADRVHMTGSARTADETWRDGLRDRIERVVRGVTEAMGCRYELTYRSRQLPATVNDPAMADLLLDVASAGAAAVEGGAAGAGELRSIPFRMPEPRLAGETFHEYSDRVPGGFWLLGVGNASKGIVHPSHHNLFDLDEEAMAVGAGMSACAAWAFAASGG